MLRLMAAWPFLPCALHTMATCDSPKSNEIFHASDADECLHSFKQAAAKSYLSSLRQVDLAAPKDRLIAAIGLFHQHDRHGKLNCSLSGGTCHLAMSTGAAE